MLIDPAHFLNHSSIFEIKSAKFKGTFIPMICLIALIFIADVSKIGGITLIIIGIAFK